MNLKACEMVHGYGRYGLVYVCVKVKNRIQELQKLFPDTRLKVRWQIRKNKWLGAHITLAMPCEGRRLNMKKVETVIDQYNGKKIEFEVVGTHWF